MKNSQKGFIVPLLLAIIAVLVIGGGFYISQIKKSEAPATVTNETQQSNLQSDTSDSKIFSEIYQDIENGFYFNFPSDWSIVQPKTGLKGSPESYSYIQSPDFNQIKHEGEESYTELKQGAEIFVYVQKSPSAKTIKDLEEFNKLGRDSGSAFVDERIVKVDGKDALLYDYTGYGGSSGHHFELLNNNRWIRIDIRHKGLDGKGVFDTILSTFKFKTPSKTTSTYTNHGFTIELPKGFTPKEEQSEGGPATMISLPVGGLAYVTDALFWEKYNISNYTYVKSQKIGETTFKVYTAGGSNLYWFKQGNVGYEFSVQKFGSTNDTMNVDYTIQLENLLKTFKFVGWPQS
ncbi:MAG: PsbP-related protein [bacterium]